MCHFHDWPQQPVWVSGTTMTYVILSQKLPSNAVLPKQIKPGISRKSRKTEPLYKNYHAFPSQGEHYVGTTQA